MFHLNYHVITDLDLVLAISFGFVENYVKSHKTSSGDTPIKKGFKYFSEGYIQDLIGKFSQHFFYFTYIYTFSSKIKTNDNYTILISSLYLFDVHVLINVSIFKICIN